jgi:hypothetical protein
VRWSRAEPDVVFKNGFAPMALADKRDWDNVQPFNLNKYVGNFRASVAVFVSTTRYRWKDGKASTWRPADWNSESTRSRAAMAASTSTKPSVSCVARRSCERSAR